jgi:xanthine dehydrogenase accessory factor
MTDLHTLFRRAAELESHAVPYAFVTVIRSLAPNSARSGDKAIVCDDGTIYGWIGGGCAQPAVIRTVRQSLSDGHPRNVRISPQANGEKLLEDSVEVGMTCHSGGSLELFIEPVLPKPELVIFGVSPVAQALASLAPRLAFSVTWVDAASAVPLGPDDVRHIGEQALEQISPGAYAVIATQGKGDLQAMKRALSIRARHVAFVASRRKADVLKESLMSSGWDPESVAAIEAPAGYAIDAQTPEEIALSVLASLVSRRRAGARAEAPAPDLRPAVAAPDIGQREPGAGPGAATQAAHACCQEAPRTQAPAARESAGHSACCQGTVSDHATAAATQPHVPAPL